MNLNVSAVKGIIFDYGGTLDTGGDHWSEVIWAAYQQAGVDVSKDIFRDAYVYAERELARVKHILPEHNFGDLLKIKMQIEFGWLAEQNHFPQEKVETVAAEVADLCYQSAKSKVEEAKVVLEALSARYPLVLVSNFYGNVETVLQDFGLKKYFPEIIESAVVGVRKPDPEIFRLGVKALGLTPEETLVVGDSYRKDIEPSEKIGCQVLWIKGKGWTVDEDLQEHENIIKCVEDVEKLLIG